MSEEKRLLYCHCAYAKVVPPATKREVLRRLGDSGVDFEAVPDLCEMAARKDPRLAELAGAPGLEVIACYPRAVRWLFHAGGSDLPEGVRVHNMRTASADELARSLGLPASEEVPS